MALKLDIRKAYDRVEWSFLEAMMCKVGFHMNWVNLIMLCVKLVSYSILINSNPQANFMSLREIRQDDSLSPYLFILCAKVLFCMLNRAESNENLTNIPLGNGSICINHLIFVEDNLLFCKASSLEWSNLIEQLESYENA